MAIRFALLGLSHACLRVASNAALAASNPELASSGFGPMSRTNLGTIR